MLFLNQKKSMLTTLLLVSVSVLCVGADDTVLNSTVDSSSIIVKNHPTPSVRSRSLTVNDESDGRQILCHILQVDVKVDEIVDEESYVCETKNGNVFGIDLPAVTIEEMQYYTNSTYLRITDAELDRVNSQVIMGPMSTLTWITTSSSSHHDRRRLAKTSGVAKVLIVRVNYRGATPKLNAADLRARILGIGNTNQIGQDMAGQFDDCSFGKLKFQAFQGQNINQGVTDISITKSVSGSNAITTLQNLVIDQVQKDWGTKNIDHIMMVFPNVSLQFNGRSYIAFAYLNSNISVFKDEWAGYLSALVHELGHNLNLHHSGANGHEYGDTSGYMGFGSRTVGGPLMCFNGQKSYTLGWYRDRTLSLNRNQLPFNGKISAFTDYAKTDSDEYVGIVLGNNNANKLYIQHNHAFGMNSGTQNYKNRITVTQAVEQFGALKSAHVGFTGRNKNDKALAIRNWDKSGYTLFINVCNVDKSSNASTRILSIHLDDGKQKSTCGGPAPTQAPVASPCSDNNSKKMFVNDNLSLKNCAWLKDKVDTNPTAGPKWVQKLCQNGNDFNQFCRRTCDRC